MKKTCKDYLLSIVKSHLGVANPGTREKDTKTTKALPYVVVYTDDRQHIERDGRKVASFKKDGQKIIRYKMYHVEVYFAVFMKGRNESQVEDLKKQFLVNLQETLDDGEGNAIEIQPEITIGIEEEGILRQDESGLEIIIKCVGGIYKDVAHGIITGIEPIPEVEEEV